MPVSPLCFGPHGTDLAEWSG